VGPRATVGVSEERETSSPRRDSKPEVPSRHIDYFVPAPTKSI